MIIFAVAGVPKKKQAVVGVSLSPTTQIKKLLAITLKIKIVISKMKTVGKFRILQSFKITGRGLVALGDLLDGKVKIGNHITFNTGTENVTLKIDGVEMTDNVSKQEYWVGFTFVYEDEDEKKNFENLKLPEQVVEILEE